MKKGFRERIARNLLYKVSESGVADLIKVSSAKSVSEPARIVSLKRGQAYTLHSSASTENSRSVGKRKSSSTVAAAIHSAICIVSVRDSHQTVNTGFSGLTVVGPQNGSSIPVLAQVSKARGQADDPANRLYDLSYGYDAMSHLTSAAHERDFGSRENLSVLCRGI